MADDADVIVVGGGPRRPRRRDAKSPTPASASSWSTRRANKALAARPSGRSADCSWSTAPNSAGSASGTVTTWRCRTGWGRRASTATEDLWPQRWAEAYVAFAAGEKRDWLRAMGHRIFPVVGWAERGGYDAMSHGNSVPRFHVTWGTGPGIVEPFERRAREAQASGRLTFKFRHRVDALTITGGAVDGITGSILEPDNVERGKSSSRKVTGDFTLARASRDRRLRRHRRQSRSGAAELAEASWRRAEEHDLRRARTCRRQDDRHHRGRRRAADQPRPDVALCRGHQELEPDLAAPRHPHPAGTVVDVVRRDRQTPALAAVPRLRHARPTAIHHGHRPRLFVVRAHPKHHQEGIRTLGLGAESRFDRQELADDRAPRHQQGRAGPGGSIQDQRR